MAFFNVREWIDRISQHPNRRTLTNVEDPTDVKTYDLSRAEGTVTTQGTAITGANLTDLERRIGSAFTAVENAMPKANPAEEATGSLTKLKVGGTVYEVEGGGGTTIEKITKAQWDAMTAEEREAFIGVVVDTNGVYLPLTAENIPFDSNDSIAEKVEKLTVKLTLAEWEAIADKQAWRNAHKNTRLVITDAPALEYTAEDLSYDGGTETVWDKIEANESDITNLDSIKQDKSTLRTDNFLVQEFQSESITIGANGALNVTANTMNYQIPNGYTPIAIAGWYTGSNDTFARSIEIASQGGQSFCVLRNVSSTAFTGTFKTKILFIKT